MVECHHWARKVFTLYFLVSILVLISPLVKAQGNLFPYEGQPFTFLKDPQLRANSKLTSRNESVTWSHFDRISESTFDSLRLLFTDDSIHWSFTSGSEPFELSIPNDVSLMVLGDRPQLQDSLFKEIVETRRDTCFFSQNEFFTDTTWLIGGTRYDVLRKIRVINNIDSLPVCNLSDPIASMINSINDTSCCNGLFPIRLIFHRYGFKRDSVDTDIASLIRATGAFGWEKWFASEERELTVLFQHPYFSFDHMLFLQLVDDNISPPIWRVEMHTFIPTHNLGDLYGKFVQNDGAERFEIK